LLGHRTDLFINVNYIYLPLLGKSMTFSVRERIKKWKRNHKHNFDKEVFTFSLDMDSVERLHRLKHNLNNMNEDVLIALALRSLEHKVDRLIKRKRRKKKTKP
jgi:hypothetical protein